LAETQTCYGVEAFEAKGRNGGYAGMYAVDLFGVGRVVVEEIWWGG
jgi:hypothetical protein